MAVAATQPVDKKLRNLTLQEKINVIKMVTEEKKSIKEVTAHFKCGKTQIYNIIKKKDTIIEKYLSSSKNDLVKVKERTAKYLELNLIVYEWYLAAKAMNIPVSGPILQQKAKEMAGIIKLDGFSASNGWLQSFRRRHNITFHISRGGRVNDIDKNPVESWHDRLQEIFQGYSSKDIANADETALFFRALPNESCFQSTNSKERFTILLVAFADGKLEKPLVIGKSEMPKCFKNLKKSQLPVEWVSNKNSWMTSTIFEEFLKKFNTRMQKENRKILLFLDNATCHPRVQLSNIRIVFLPPDMTSLLQPLNNGIIQNIKVNYRKMLLQHIIANMDDVNIKIDVLDAITFLSCSVKCVTQDSVRKCFRNCGFILDGAVSVSSDEFVHCKNSDYSEIQQLIEVMYKDDNVASAESFVNIDDNVFTDFGEVELESQKDDKMSDSDDEPSEDDCEGMETPTASQALGYINALKYYAKMKGENELYEKVMEVGFAFNRAKKCQNKKK